MQVRNARPPRPPQLTARLAHGPPPAPHEQAPGLDLPARRELRDVQDGRERARGHEALQRVQDDQVSMRACSRLLSSVTASTAGGLTVVDPSGIAGERPKGSILSAIVEI